MLVWPVLIKSFLYSKNHKITRTFPHIFIPAYTFLNAYLQIGKDEVGCSNLPGSSRKHPVSSRNRVFFMFKNLSVLYLLYFRFSLHEKGQRRRSPGAASVLPDLLQNTRDETRRTVPCVTFSSRHISVPRLRGKGVLEQAKN